MGKGENAGYQHFPPPPTVFQKVSFIGSLKVGIVRKRVKLELLVCVKNTSKFVLQMPSTVFASIVLNLCIHTDHILKFCKT